MRTGTYRNETRVLCVQNGALGRSRTLATGARGRTLWTGSTRLTEAQGARGEVLRGRSVTLLGVTNGGATDAPKKAPGRTEPATKKAHSAPQRRRILQLVSVAGGRVRAEGVFPEPKEVERYHRFPRRAVTLWPARMQAVFSLPKRGATKNRRCTVSATGGAAQCVQTSLTGIRGYPSHAERRTAEAHTGTTCSSACDSLAREGVCSQLHKGRGALRGVCLIM